MNETCDGVFARIDEDENQPSRLGPPNPGGQGGFSSVTNEGVDAFLFDAQGLHFAFTGESPYPQHGVSVTDVPPQPLERSSARSSKSGFSGLTRPWHRNCAKLLGALPGRVAFYTLPAFPGECLGPECNCRNCRTTMRSCQCPRSHGGCLQPLQLRGKRNLRLSVNIRVANAYTRYSAILNFNFRPTPTTKKARQPTFRSRQRTSPSLFTSIFQLLSPPRISPRSALWLCFLQFFLQSPTPALCISNGL